MNRFKEWQRPLFDEHGYAYMKIDGRMDGIHKKIPLKITKELIHDYKEGVSFIDLAKKYNSTKKVVINRLIEAGIHEINNSNRKRSKKYILK